MTRIFHVYADGKRWREISFEEYRGLTPWQQKAYLICRIHRGWKTAEITLCKGNNWIYMPLKQLKEILAYEAQ